VLCSYNRLPFKLSSNIQAGRFLYWGPINLRYSHTAIGCVQLNKNKNTVMHFTELRKFCWLFGGIVRYRLSSQQKVHRCNSVLEKGKSMRGDNSFYFLQLSIIYGIILRLIYSTSYQITHAPWCHIRLVVFVVPY
jgi:hypothetical protein